MTSLRATLLLVIGVSLTAACSDTVDPSPEVTEQATAPSPAALPDLTGWYVARSVDGALAVAWRPVGGEVPRNEEFDLEVRLFRRDTPLPGAALAVRGWMPDHGHGMLRDPLVTDKGDGAYAVEGVLLHMRGHWELRFEVTANDSAETVTFERDV